MESRQASSSLQRQKRDAKDVILEFYNNYNSSNIDGVMSLMAEDCKYHDMIYLEPFEGHEEIRAYFEKVEYISFASTNNLTSSLYSIKLRIQDTNRKFLGTKFLIAED